jgi:hypothetical protein
VLAALAVDNLSAGAPVVLVAPYTTERDERCLRLCAASAAACVRSPQISDGIPAADACLAAADHAGYRPRVPPATTLIARPTAVGGLAPPSLRRLVMRR